MNTRIFDFDMTNSDSIILNDRERLYRIVTNNVCDSLYIIATPGDVEEFARDGMRAKYGLRGPHMIKAVDNVSYLLHEEV